MASWLQLAQPMDKFMVSAPVLDSTKIKVTIASFVLLFLCTELGPNCNETAHEEAVNVNCYNDCAANTCENYLVKRKFCNKMCLTGPMCDCAKEYARTSKGVCVPRNECKLGL